MPTRRYSILVQDSGVNSPPVQIGNVPNCMGWDLSFSSVPGTNMLLGWQATVQDEWQNGGPGVPFGPLAASVGGKVFVPFPALTLFGRDFIGANVGNSATIRIIARPVLADGWSSGSSSLLGVVAQTAIAPAAVGVFNLSPSALDYKVTSNQAGPFRVSMIDPFGGEMSFWEIADPSSSAHDEGGQKWRETGPPGSQISITNGGGANGLLTLWQRYDFRRLR